MNCILASAGVREKCAKTFMRVVQKPCAARIVLQDSERGMRLMPNELVGEGLAEQGIEIVVIRQVAALPSSLTNSQMPSEATLALVFAFYSPYTDFEAT